MKGGNGHDFISFKSSSSEEASCPKEAGNGQHSDEQPLQRLLLTPRDPGNGQESLGKEMSDAGKSRASNTSKTIKNEYTVTLKEAGTGQHPFRITGKHSTE